MSKTFRPYQPNQPMLLPPDIQDWLPEGHLAYFISDVVDSLDLSPILTTYEAGSGRGQPPYHPVMMVKVWLFGYCTGVLSSRKIEKATHENIAFRVLAAGNNPDHDSLAEFRRRHLSALASLFGQVLKLCQGAGLVKLGYVAIDGTKIRANASIGSGMSYSRMEQAEDRLQADIKRFLEEAEQTDQEEDRRFGRGQRGDELPPDLAKRQSRLKKIQEAKAVLEREAQEQAERDAAEAIRKNLEREQLAQSEGHKPKGRPHTVPDPSKARPDGKAQRNFTDPESKIMKDGATRAFVQAYNAQIAVDREHQIIVASLLSQARADVGLLLPVFEEVAENTGRLPVITAADAGYFSDANVTAPSLTGTALYIPPNRLFQEPPSGSRSGHPISAPAKAMRRKVESLAGSALYHLRQQIVEPVFGQIKEARGIRRFSFRGLAKATAEWDLVCLTHNLLKLFRARNRAAQA